MAAALGVRFPVSRLKAFRSDLERKLQKAEVTVLYDLGGCERLARLSPRIDAIPVVARKLHSKISLLMWVREARAANAPPDRRIRVIVGSANLTRQGFRHNYECVAAVDFGGRSAPPRTLLTKALGFVRLIGAGPPTPQLARQLAAFESQAALLPAGTAATVDAVALVAAEEVVPSMRQTWAALSGTPPEKITVVSPFWTEGVTASEALADLIRQLGDPATVEFVCRGEKSADGKRWLPVFDGGIAVDLKTRLTGRVFLRATKPDADLTPQTATSVEIGDELEEKELSTRLGGQQPSAAEVHRALHAKIILLDGRNGSVLYIGSSNCTRRGLALGGPTNHEAGFVYRLAPRQRKQIAGLLEFAGPSSEVFADTPPETLQPAPVKSVFVPTFLAEVVATGTSIDVRFREPAPPDLVLLMPIPTKAGDMGFWLLHRADAHVERSGQPVTTDLKTCPQCDEKLTPVAADPTRQPPLPHVFVEVRWGAIRPRSRSGSTTKPNSRCCSSGAGRPKEN